MTATPPVVTKITTDKASYARGEVITVTMAYQPGTSEDDQTSVITGTATDQATGQAGQLTVSFVVLATKADQTAPSVKDSRSLAWTKVSDANGTAVFTAIAA